MKKITWNKKTITFSNGETCEINQVDWDWISKYQTFSEDFIREFHNEVDWYRISIYQKLSEEFIREFQNKVDWNYISQCQKLSEEFIREFQNKVYWDNISQCQKLSEEFIREFDLKIKDFCWLYWTKEEKLKYIKENKLDEVYDLIDDEYLIAYKSTKKDGTSVFCNWMKYEVGNTYEDWHCDCNANCENSFGLSAWTKEEALEYHNNGLLFKVKIKIDDIGCFVHNGGKIRCWKLEVLEKLS